MNYKETTGKSIDEAFIEFHTKNPKIYKHFEKYAFDAIRKGKSKISFKMIMEVIRWNAYLKNAKDECFKIDNNFGSRYARIFAEKHPKHINRINFRRLTSK